MARIRTIKPEFPQSESIGKISRDARLLFVQLWTIADDEGRARAAPRMLASLLFPYDDDAPAMIGKWMDELQAVGCIRRYSVHEAAYLEIPGWADHQKIDKPSKSRLPGFQDADEEPSRAFDEHSIIVNMGPRTLDLGREGTNEADASLSRTAEPEPVAKPKSPNPKGSRLPADWSPSDDGRAFAANLLETHGARIELAKFRDYWAARAGAGGVKLDWEATWRNWVRSAAERLPAARAGPNSARPPNLSPSAAAAKALREIANGTHNTSPGFKSEQDAYRDGPTIDGFAVQVP